MLSPVAPRRILVVACLIFAAVGLSGPAQAATPDAGPPPNTMAALGDSITTGFNACGFYFDCKSRSWSTGTSSTVNSHYLRILAVNQNISGRNFNDAVSGARAYHLNGQAQQAAGQRAQYVTVLIGANDACKATESQMTPVSTFRSQVDAALSTLNASVPSARIFVASIPDLKRLWYVGKGSFAARTAWAVGGICQTMLKNPLSTAQADVDRRNRVRQRVLDYNTQLQQSCAAHTRCRHDASAVFNYPFTLNMVSGWDYFHPNTYGQSVLARVTYQAGYAW
jgi:lysophospholipase L1-like esterase